MQTNDDITALPVGELQKQKKTLRTLSVTWVVILIILAATAISVSLRQGYSVFTILPVVFLPGLIMSKRRLDLVKEELKKRSL